MTTLAADKSRAFELGDRNLLPVIAADIIYEGAAVGDNASGYMRPLVAGDPFCGFAVEKVDNSAGAAGDKRVLLKTRGRIVLPVTGASSVADRGKPVFASDDDTFTLTQSTNTYIGEVERWISSTSCVVAFDVTAPGGALVELTDSSGGTASDTLAAISGTYTQSEIRNSIASLAAKLNALIRRGK